MFGITEPYEKWMDKPLFNCPSDDRHAYMQLVHMKFFCCDNYEQLCYEHPSAQSCTVLPDASPWSLCINGSSITISGGEARRLVLAQTPMEGRSYASVTKSLKTSEVQTNPVIILSNDSDSDLISSPTKGKAATDLKKRRTVSRAQKALALKISKKGTSLKDLKSRRSVALEMGKAGLATKDLPTLFGNPSTSELLKIHPSDEEDDDLQMSCDQPATPLTGVDNSPPPTF
ncbi:hypothetical protein HNY73_020982 [Argiope bruennichi]|uniref:Uncharacterized protein n=1 Tax=Argiope bruennichi TaxID=94029 RepID=A0A8T0ECG8_ARGBR|nr:hypothetical protein HNY73_020982 [Argiope bruennichi]